MNSPQEILKKYWGYAAFRPRQLEIIESVMNHHHTLALLPTGGGKSICFQIPGLMLEGLTIVVSPLVALMLDQVAQLKERGIKAHALYSGMPNREIDVVLDNCIYGMTKFLYVSPERLSSDLFIARLKQMRVSLLAIDEAHCISQWGYDFRPAYLEIKNIYQYIPDANKIALTATATQSVKEDICEKLILNEAQVFQKSFARGNLSYSVFRMENKGRKLLEVLRNVPGSSVVYVRSRAETEKVAHFLHLNDISSDFYHAGLDSKKRAIKQQYWTAGKRRVMVATNAFGMGIDKSDVRTVVHLDLPDSLEAYYQEAGRAGRDEKKAFAVLLYSSADIAKLRQSEKLSNPSIEFIQSVYQAIANHYKIAVGSSQWQSFDFEIKSFCHQHNLNTPATHHAVQKLQEMGLILVNNSLGKNSQLKIAVSQEEIYKFCISNANYEPVLKAALRLYGGGIYTELQNISEYEIARLIKTDQSNVSKKLRYLVSIDLIIYEPIRTKPQLTFLLPRIEVASLSKPFKQVQPRQKIISQKINAIIDYAEHKRGCRTRIFQEYFNEASYENCGVCDICLESKNTRQKASHDRLKQEILSLISTEPIHLDEVYENFPGYRVEDFNEVIRDLLDSLLIRLKNGKVFIDS